MRKRYVRPLAEPLPLIGEGTGGGGGGGVVDGSPTSIWDLEVAAVSRMHVHDELERIQRFLGGAA